MLGRTANDLFWLSRYLERAENMARLLEVGYRIALLPREGEGYNEEWRSTLQSAGCELGYLSRHEALTTRDVIDYLLFDPENPSSVRTCLSIARRNGRAQRTALTREMWESLNSAYIEFQAIKPAELKSDRLPQLLDWVKRQSATYRGVLLNTILRNDTFYFSQLGTFVERADNTARIIDVKYYVLLPSTGLIGTSVDNVQWASILRSVSAHRSYRWVYKDSYRPWKIADFLILNPEMPRSLAACYVEIESALAGLDRFYDKAQAPDATARETLELLSRNRMDEIFQGGLHEFLTDFIYRNGRLATDIAEAYHFNG
ncbi:MAG: alpha-E domain-containing protein [Hyphomicrobium sp.]|nr:alpha-E domain-containing protein [Hyphomicrobium sp.]